MVVVIIIMIVELSQNKGGDNMAKLKITGFKTFGVKKLAKVVDNEELKIFNVFGFGFWIIKGGCKI